MGIQEKIAKTLDGKGEYGLLCVTFIAVMVILSTMSFALSTVDSLKEHENVFTLIEAISILIFTIEYLLRMWTSEKGALGYMIQPIALIDLCSILPSWLDAVVPGDQFPAFNFLRMLRIFKFLSASKRGEAGVKAFEESWNDNKSLIIAASFAGGAVWLATSALLYLVERNNDDMLWCYPPPAVGESYPFLGGSHGGGSSGRDRGAGSSRTFAESASPPSSHHSGSTSPTYSPSSSGRSAASPSSHKYVTAVPSFAPSHFPVSVDSSQFPTVLDCVCTEDDGCSGPDCLCQNRFKSIPSSMFFTLLSLAGEYPLADKYSQWGRVIAAITAVLSVGIFAIPTGLVGAAIEGAVGALNAGDGKDYDVDEEDVAEIVAEANKMLNEGEAAAAAAAGDALEVPSYTTSILYKKLTGWFIILSCSTAILGTSTAVRQLLGEDSVISFLLFYALNVFFILFFLIEWLMRLGSAGVLPTLKALFVPSLVSMPLVDVMAWLPELLWLAVNLTAIHSNSKGSRWVDDNASHSGTRMLQGLDGVVDSGGGGGADIGTESFSLSSASAPLGLLGHVGAPPLRYFPAYVTLTCSLFRMMKFERYIHGFKILGRVVEKSQGVLMIGGMAAAVATVFASTLMYYAERNNPDPKTQKYYSSIPMAAWMTTLNMSGEAPLCDYTTAGAWIVGMLSVAATAIFAIPVGALGSGFEAVISEITTEQGDKMQEQGEGEGEALLPTTILALGINGTAGGRGRGEGLELTSRNAYYGAIPSSEEGAAAESESVRAAPKQELSMLQRLVEGRGDRGQRFLQLSLLATLFAVSLEILSTVDYTSLLPEQHAASSKKGSLKLKAADEGFWESHVPTAEGVQKGIALSEFGVVCWFTVEYLLRLGANGSDYVFSWLGAVDALSTFPYFIAHGVGGSQWSQVMDVYDGPLRALRILRLVRLDAYVPSLTLIDDAVRECWAGLSVSLFAGAVIWFFFNECLYFAERDDVEEGENKRFRNALSSMQYSAVLLSGDYPITDFSLTGKFLCVCAVVIAVGVVAVPASILAGAFVNLLQQQAEERRKARFEAASKMQNIFLKNKRLRQSAAVGENEAKFSAAVKSAMKNSAMLRGLDSSPENQPLAARFCIWKNNRTAKADTSLFGITGADYKSFMMKLVGLNILAVVLESIPELESAIPHYIWQGFEGVSVVIFTFEYCVNVLTARYDPRWKFSRWEYMTSFVGGADFWSIVPFFLQTLILPAVYGADPNYAIDATVFRILRLARIIELEQFFDAFSILGDVFEKAGPVLKATGVLALILWVGGATAFYYADPHAEFDDDFVAAGGESPAVFTSIVDSLFYMSIFMAGEWCTVDFTPLGSVLCTFFAIVGVALFSIPVGVLFEGFQDMLEERHGGKDKDKGKDKD